VGRQLLVVASTVTGVRQITATVEALRMPAETTPIGMSTPDAIALLPLPARLSDPQRDGHICVYGGEALTTQTAIDLGSRRVDDRLVSPRACRTCVAHIATGVLHDHAVDCKDCARDTEPVCPVSRALYRVVRLGRQR
jgi:hypothetical protein